ncbi:hypothetical protein B5K03_04355 [Rhizobium phaseoli]|nr:hypothetical protein B5K03_04355 [Rhizobium phaseoli]
MGKKRKATSYLDGEFGRGISSHSVIPGLEPRIHATRTGGCGVDARLKAEHDGGGGCWSKYRDGRRRNAPFFGAGTA